MIIDYYLYLMIMIEVFFHIIENVPSLINIYDVITSLFASIEPILSSIAILSGFLYFLYQQYSSINKSTDPVTYPVSSCDSVTVKKNPVAVL